MADVHYTDPSRQSDLPEYDEENVEEYVNDLQPIKDRRRKTKRNRIILLVVILLAAASAAAWFFLIRDEKAQNPATQTTQPEQTTVDSQPAQLENYTSSDLNISFDYPGNWELDDTTEGRLTVTSPVAKLADFNGEQVDGKVVVSFLKTGSNVPAFEGGSSATSVIDSDKMTYDAPTQNQRKQTFLSFAGFGAAGLDAVFITGDAGYQEGQLIPESDIQKIEPIISVRFYRCQGSECKDSHTLGTGEWSVNQTILSAHAILKSLKVE